MRTTLEAFELVKQTCTTEKDCLSWSTDSKTGNKTRFSTNTYILIEVTTALYILIEVTTALYILIEVTTALYNC